VPSALYTWARTSCCRKAVSFSQVTANPPSVNAAIAGYHWSPAVAVLMRNSLPDMVPSALKTWPRTACPDVSPPLTLLSCQVTTNWPSARPVTLAFSCVPYVVVLTWNSAPDLVPSALNTCPFTAYGSAASGSLLVQVTTNCPSARDVMLGSL